MTHEGMIINKDGITKYRAENCDNCLKSEIVGHCKYCMKDLCQSCTVKWNSDIYGNKIEKFDDFLIVCRYCTNEAEKAISLIKEVRSRADEVIQEIVNRYQFQMTEDRDDKNN